MADSVSNATGSKPPLPPSRGGNFQNDPPGILRDTARYLLIPDVDFARPYISIPGGLAFIWPLGTEGFEVVDHADLGKHKYIGDIRIDVEIMHRQETTITMTGIFPGHTAIENMQALRAVFSAEQPPGGKILHLPGVLLQAQYVACEDLRSVHSEDDRTMDIAYSLSMVRIGTGLDATKPPITASTGVPKTTASGTHSFRATATVRTLRTIAKTKYGDANQWTRLYSIPHNATFFTSRKIATHAVPDYRLPIGTLITY